MRFLEDQGSTFSRSNPDLEDDFSQKGNFYTWMIVIMVLLGLNLGSWSFCHLVFGHPDHPFSYRLLTKLEKLEPLKGFRATTVPGGKFKTAKDLYARAYPFSKTDLRAYNGLLKRHYLWNYTESHEATFIYGTFIVDRVRAVDENDLFPRGLAIHAEAFKFPDVKIQLILPTREPIESVDGYYKKGDKLTIERSTMAASVLHATKDGDNPMEFVAVPLVTKDGNGNDLNFKTAYGAVVKLHTPERLNIK